MCMKTEVAESPDQRCNGKASVYFLSPMNSIMTSWGRVYVWNRITIGVRRSL